MTTENLAQEFNEIVGQIIHPREQRIFRTGDNERNDHSGPEVDSDCAPEDMKLSTQGDGEDDNQKVTVPPQISPRDEGGVAACIFGSSEDRLRAVKNF